MKSIHHTCTLIEEIAFTALDSDMQTTLTDVTNFETLKAADKDSLLLKLSQRTDQQRAEIISKMIKRLEQNLPKNHPILGLTGHSVSIEEITFTGKRSIRFITTESIDERHKEFEKDYPIVKE